MGTDEFSISCCSIDAKVLRSYKSGDIDASLKARVRYHLENCSQCWARWNRFRWDCAQGTLGYVELQEYLGDTFQRYFDASWALAHEWHERNPTSKAQVEEFYRQTPFYVYNLLIWQESGHRPRYVERALSALELYNSKTILDFGCGIGNDGLVLLGKGYDVIFCEVNVACIEFLKWRLKRRKLSALVVTPDDVTTLSFDTFWAMDVIEHLPSPAETLAPLLDSAAVFVHDTEDVTQASGRHPFHINHSEEDITDFLLTKGFVRNRNFKGIKVWYRV